VKTSTLQKVIDITANILYVAQTKRTSLDRAFQEVTKNLLKSLYDRVPHGLVYRLSRCVARDYYKLLYISECVFGRRKTSMRFLVKLWIALYGEEMVDEGIVRRIRKKLGFDESKIEEFLSSLDSYERLAVQYSYPLWFVRAVCKYLGVKECENLLSGLNRDDIVWIRVNTLKSDIDKVVKRLSDEGIDVVVDKDLPYMLRPRRFFMTARIEEMIRNCEIVLQDKASAMVVEELAPEPGDLIVDLAAAPGVKASLAMQLTENRARLVLIDVSRERVSRMKKFLKCMNVDTDRVDILLADSTRISISKTFDKVLIDAPCTGSGTIPRDPAIKLHLSRESVVNRYVEIQRAMLREGLSLADEVVYATCSVLAEEGEEIVKDFRDFLTELRIGAAGSYVPSLGNRVRRFYPHVDETHGFFVSKLRGLRA